MKVFVYFNLTKKVWSIKALDGHAKGKVIAHSKAVVLSNVTPKVSEATRQRVIREKKKYVHAGLVGNLVCFDEDSVEPTKNAGFVGIEKFKSFSNSYCLLGSNQIGYNPYKSAYFYSKDQEGMVFESATEVVMLGNGSVYTFGGEFEKLSKKAQLSLDLAS